jgi:hypothetical protein
MNNQTKSPRTYTVHKSRTQVLFSCHGVVLRTKVFNLRLKFSIIAHNFDNLYYCVAVADLLSQVMNTFQHVCYL